MEEKSVSVAVAEMVNQSAHQPPQAVEDEDTPQSHHFNLKEEGQEARLMQHPRRPNLSSLQVPVRSLENTSSFARIDIPSPNSTRNGLPPRPSSAKFMSSMKNLLPQKSSRGKNLSHDGEQTVLIIPDTPLSDKPSNRPSTSRSFSLNKILFSSSTTSTHSLPVTPVADASPGGAEESNLNGHCQLPKSEVEQQIRRSFSVPVNVKARSLRRTDSSGRLVRVISATSRSRMEDNTLTDKSTDTEIACDDSGEDILEEEAVCRICFVELGEGGETFKMECSCKGELALAHKECAIKWFSIKGNKTCDVCKQDVRNLPVTLLKIQNPATVVRRPPVVVQQREVTRYRVWQDVPILVMISMLAYFCFLEQLLVSDMGPRALAIALPFSCVLGFISTMIASTMGVWMASHLEKLAECLLCVTKYVSKSYMWAYASFQFAIVILFAHIFYTVLNVNAVLSVLLSSFTGFGIAISTNSLLVEYLRWRGSRRQSSHQHLNGLRQHHQQELRHQQNHRHYQRDNHQLQHPPTNSPSVRPAGNSGQQETGTQSA